MPVQLCLPLEEPRSLRRAFSWMLETIDCAAATRVMHAAHARYLLEYFGDRDVRAIGYPELRAYLRDERKRGLAKETVKKRLSTLKLALLEAVARRVLDRLPEWPRIRSDSRPKEAFWTREQLDQAVAACDDDELAAWIIVGWWLGLHASDIDRLRWVDVDLERGTWTRRNTKTAVPWAELPLPEAFRAWLRARREQLAPHPRDLVVGVRLGHPNSALRALCRRAGVPTISTIGLRHSCETHLEAQGTSELFQQTWLGLTSPRMLKRHYRHPTAAGLAAGILLVNAG